MYMSVHFITHELTVYHIFSCYFNYMRFRKMKCGEEQPLRYPSPSAHTVSVQDPFCPVYSICDGTTSQCFL